MLSFFLLVNCLPHRFQVLITASKAVDADVCCCVGQVTEKTTSPQQMHCATKAAFHLRSGHNQKLRKDGPANGKVMLIVITMVMLMLMLMLRPLATAGKCQQQQ